MNASIQFFERQNTPCLHIGDPFADRRNVGLPLKLLECFSTEQKKDPLGLFIFNGQGASMTKHGGALFGGDFGHHAVSLHFRP